MAKQSILSLFQNELEDSLVNDLNEKKFRAKQIWHWLYTKGARDFEIMTTLNKDLRKKLDNHFQINRLEVVDKQQSADGTIKWLLKLFDGKEVETVYIPEEDRATVCISSQVGCNMACKFCYTGTQRMVRNLTAEEILLQFMHVKDEMNDWQADKERRVTNIVMMGMGEPLQNYKEVSRALLVAMNNEGLAVSKRKVTLSTCGIPKMITRCGQELEVNLALSLHAPNNAIRSQIMPINDKYDIEEVLDACSTYQNLSNSRRITIEYIMIEGLNDKKEHALELMQLLKRKQIPSKINLIPFNPWPGSDFKPSSKKAISEFTDLLTQNGFIVPVRKKRGEDILAACGQLKSSSKQVSKKMLSD